MLTTADIEGEVSGLIEDAIALGRRKCDAIVVRDAEALADAIAGR